MHSEEFKNRLIPLQGSIYRLARYMLGNREKAEDSVQEIFLKLWTKKETLNSINNIKAFALQVARNHCLDKLKRKKYITKEIEDQVSEAPNAHRQMELNDNLARMQQIIDQLPEQQRALIYLRNIEDLSMEEIAQITGLNIAHIRVTLSRARKTIREIYEKLYSHE